MIEYPILQSRGNKVKFENQQKACSVCKQPTFLRTNGHKPLCAIHFIIHDSIEEVIDGTGSENLPEEKNKVGSQARTG